MLNSIIACNIFVFLKKNYFYQNFKSIFEAYVYFIGEIMDNMFNFDGIEID